MLKQLKHIPLYFFIYMTLFKLVTANLEHGRRNCDSGTLKGILLKESQPDIIFIQESTPERLSLGDSYQLLDFPDQNTPSDSSERMDIYYCQNSSWNVTSQTLINSYPQASPRPSLLVTLEHPSTTSFITLANVHLCGGRYDENDQLGGLLRGDLTSIQQLKTELLQDLVENYHVDIIAGDFNSDLNCFLTQGQLCSRQLSFFEKVSPGKSLQVYQQWNLAPFNYLYSQGYQLAYTGSSNGDLMSTSIFGNHPDAIWFKPEKIQYGKQGMIDFLSPNLSDHQGLSWSCQVVH